MAGKNKTIFSNKVFANISWIVCGRILQAIINFVISILTARYLGPSNFGVINYAASITAFFLPLMQLGFDHVLVFKIKNNPEKEGEYIGTAITLSSFSSVACIACITRLVSLINSNNDVIVLVTALYCLSLFFQSFDLIRYWFQAYLISKYVSVISLIVYTAVALYKAFLLITGKSVIWFAISNSIDYCFISILMALLYKKKKNKKMSISFEAAKELLSVSKHFIIPAFMIVVYGQTDRVMLTLMLGESYNGIYSASYQCAGITSFVFSAIVVSFKPIIFEAKKNGETEKYQKTISLLYGIIFYISILQGIVMTVFSDFIISVLYGIEYVDSSIPLKILSWYQAFSYFGLVKDTWALAEKKQKYLWIFYFSGAVLNVVLNFVLIPYIGVSGAALATLFTEFSVNFLMSFVVPSFKENGKLILKGINPVFLLSFIKRRQQHE